MIDGQQLSTQPVEAEPASEWLAHPPPTAGSVFAEVLVKCVDEPDVPISVYGRIAPTMISSTPRLPIPTTHFLPCLR